MVEGHGRRGPPDPEPVPPTTTTLLRAMRVRELTELPTCNILGRTENLVDVSHVTWRLEYTTEYRVAERVLCEYE